jgi:hypothetical protein
VKAMLGRVELMAGKCSAERLALLIAVGFVLGTFPIVGCPTVLCLVAAMVFRLNVAALQVVNQISSPLQLALLVPFARIGRIVALSPGNSVLCKVGVLGVQAVTGWLVMVVPAGALLYIGVLYAIRLSRRGNTLPRAIGNRAESTTFLPQMGSAL